MINKLFHSRLFFFVLFSALLMVASCGERKANESAEEFAEEEPEDLPDEEEDETPLLDTFTVKGDSVTIPEFEIEVDLTDEAELLLEKAGETIIIQAYITGLPKDGAKIEVTEMGEVYLADPNIELKDWRVARFQNVNISKKSFESLASEDFQVLINIFSGRRSTDVNILDCDILQEPISVVRGKRHVLSGKLIDTTY